MATSAEAISDAEVSLGRVFQLALQTIRNNPVVTLLLAFLFGTIPTLLASYGWSRVTDDAASSGDAVVWGLFVVNMFMNLVISALTQAFQTRATVAEAEGRRAEFAECVRAGIAVLIPSAGVAILVSVLITFGYVMLVVPGLILGAIWSVAIPALVEERQGVFASMQRSRFLTRGARSKIFGLLLVLLVISILVMVLVETISGQWYSNSLAAPYRDPTYLLLSVIATTLMNLFWGAVQASLYVELRDWKDGPDADQLAKIFA